jgi:hypothetical protein
MGTATAYFGLDYIAAATAIGGMYLLGNRNRAGFVLYAFSSLAMIGVALLIASPPIFIANAIALAVTIRGFWNWVGGCMITGSAEYLGLQATGGATLAGTSKRDERNMEKPELTAAKDAIDAILPVEHGLGRDDALISSPTRDP